MARFQAIVEQVIREADVLLLVIDARMVEETRHPGIEGQAHTLGKPLVYVCTKCDLVDKETAEQHKRTLRPCVFVSATKYYGMTMLHEQILRAGRGKEGDIVVGVLGYPNVGKSSLINALKGKGSARVSKHSGQTRGVQRIRVDDRIVVLDTPGVLSHDDDAMTRAVTGSIDYTKVKDPDLVVLHLLNEHPGVIEEHYDVSPHDDPEETIICIAQRLRMFKKGGEPDIDKTSRVILKEWQTGKVRKKS